MSIVHGRSIVPGSVKLMFDRVTAVWHPISAEPNVGCATVGATFSSVSVVESLSVAPSLSVTVRPTS